MKRFFDYFLLFHNVWFTLPLVSVFVLAILQLVLGGFEFGDAELDVDTDLDLDLDLDVDVDVDAELDSEIDSEFVAAIFGFLGAGKVPFLILLIAFFMFWGLTGLTANQFLIDSEKIIESGAKQMPFFSLIFAFIASVFGTRYLAIGLSKLLPESESAIRQSDLVGKTARVISGRVTTTFGTARVSVGDGRSLTISCRIRSDEDQPLKNDYVLLLEYESDQKIFDVTKIDQSIV